MESYQIISGTFDLGEMEVKSKQLEQEKQKKIILDRLHAEEIPLN